MLLKFWIVEHKQLCILHIQYHGYWWPDDVRSKGISSLGVDLITQEYSAFTTRRVKKFLVIYDLIIIITVNLKINTRSLILIITVRFNFCHSNSLIGCYIFYFSPIPWWACHTAQQSLNLQTMTVYHWSVHVLTGGIFHASIDTCLSWFPYKWDLVCKVLNDCYTVNCFITIYALHFSCQPCMDFGPNFCHYCACRCPSTSRCISRNSVDYNIRTYFLSDFSGY